MSDLAKQLLLQLILILCNAFFAATEIAVISLNEKKVKAQAESGDKKAAKMLKMIEEPTRFLSTIQIGITLAGFLGSAFAADNFAERLSGLITRIFHVSAAGAALINSISVIIITLVLSFFTLVLGELVPKRIAMRNKEKLARFVCGFISGLSLLLKPIIWLLTVSTNGVLRLFGINPKEEEEPVSEEDIVLMLNAGANEGGLNQEDVEYIKNVFSLDRLSAEEVMTPRKAMISLPEDAGEEEILRVIGEEGYSRIPVTDADGKGIIGVLHAKEYLLKKDQPDFRLSELLHQPVFVPETIHLDRLFKEMQTSCNHLAIVVNEYGEVSGLITLEDVIEEIVGEIWDEGDEIVETFTKLSEDTTRVSCSVSVAEFFEYFSLEPDEEIGAATVNGWLIEQTGDIQKTGFVFDYRNLKITVTKADDVMMQEIRVQVKKKAELSAVPDEK